MEAKSQLGHDLWAVLRYDLGSTVVLLDRVGPLHLCDDLDSSNE